MPITCLEENSGELLAIYVSGKLTVEDYEQLGPQFERLVSEHGTLRVLFDMTDFHGWTASALWSDTKFALHHFKDIERLAMVGDKRWQEGVAVFCRPFTRAKVRYFDHADGVDGRRWLKDSCAD